MKCFRTENGREFRNSTIATYFKADGILHDSSCVNNHQDNGLTERKIGQIPPLPS